MGPYDKLSKGTLNKWFTSNGKVWVHVQACATNIFPQVQHMTPLVGVPELTNELIKLLLKMRKLGVSLHARIV
jgi:hypothetical protein